MHTDNYLRLLEEIDETAISCRRDPQEIELVVVTKTFPFERIISVYQAGCREFGESRVQEALKKMEGAPADIHWHFIGTLQKNKIKKVISKFSLIHSIDSIELARSVSSYSQEAQVTTHVLLQVNTSNEANKHGLSVAGWRDGIQDVLSLPNLSVDGLMTIGPNVEDEQMIRKSFSELREFRDELQLPHLSMGMTNDYHIAIQEGATILRVGSAIFGDR